MIESGVVHLLRTEIRALAEQLHQGVDGASLIAKSGHVRIAVRVRQICTKRIQKHEGKGDQIAASNGACVTESALFGP